MLKLGWRPEPTLSTGELCGEQGPDVVRDLDRDRSRRCAMSQQEKLGLKVTIDLLSEPA
jgi:hypothetical protein